MEFLRSLLGQDNRLHIVEALKGIFGLGESPRLWYLRFRNVLKTITFQESKLVLCLFFCFKDSQLIALITVHVDDALMGGSKEAEEIWHMLKQQLKFGSWESLKQGAKFLGRRMKQSDDCSTIDVDMNEYSSATHEMPIPVSGDDAAETPLDDKAMAQFRATVGQLGWLAFAVSKLQQSLTIASQATIRDLNQTVRRARQGWTSGHCHG